MYKILYNKKILKEMNELENKDYLKIRERILTLENEPRPVGVLKLTGNEGYRIRIGNFRILYIINDIDKTIKLLKIGHRKEIYKKN